MLRFRLGRVPVEVHFSHFLFSALLAYSFRPGRLSAAWPNRVLGDASDPAYGQTYLIFVVGWMAVIFASVLFHELGHASVSLAYGYRPDVRLEWLGGHTRPNAPGAIPWHKDILLTFAGPLFGATLGAASLGLLSLGAGRHEIAGYFLRAMAQANFFWAVLNLLPVAPLDGGRIAGALLQRAFQRKGFILTQGLSLLVCAAIIGLAAWDGLQTHLFTVLLFGSFGLRAFQLLAAALKGQGALEPGHPSLGHLQEAARLWSAGKPAEATRSAEAALAADPPREVHARAHHLLGWMALKRGDGRLALDHFSQVHGIEVEQHALAAAFSLVGDDARALPLWELAHRETSDPTVLHEWAGALVRLGRTWEAQRLPNVSMAAAYRCAERVFYLRGQFLEAAEVGKQAFAQKQDPGTAYDVACALARGGDLDQALQYLEKARQVGFRDNAHARTDPDLDPLREDPRFTAWLRTLGA